MFFLWLAFRKISFSEIAAMLTSVRPGYLCLLALLAPLDFLIRGLRLKVLLSGFGNLPAAATIRITAIGFALNNILPFRLGELSRVALLSKEHNLPFTGVLATILAERLLDVMTICAVFLCTVRMSPGFAELPSFIQTASLLLPALAIGAAAVAWGSHIVTRAENSKFALNHPRIHALLDKFATATHALRCPLTGLKAALLSIALWLLSGSAFFVGGLALGLEPPISYGQSVFLMCATALVSVIPAAPGYFGTFEFAVKKLATGWGYSAEAGVALAALVHLTLYIAVVCLGLLCLYWSGKKIRQLLVSLPQS